MKLRHLLLGLALVFGVVNAAQAVVIDFNSLQNEGWGTQIPPVYQEQGFQLSSSGGYWLDNTAGALTLVANDPGGPVYLSSSTVGGLFQLNSIAVDSLFNNSSAFNITFIGQQADKSIVSQTFNVLGQVNTLQTLTFDADFTNLVSVRWFQGNDPMNVFAFGKINVTPLDGTPPPASVPEPATMLLFGAGLLGLAGVSRRKN